jgi:hypothetical protein
MNINELITNLELWETHAMKCVDSCDSESGRVNSGTFLYWTGKAQAFRRILECLKRDPLVSDMVCKKCGGEVKHAFYCPDAGFRCKVCGTPHKVDTIQTCRLEEEG